VRGYPAAQELVQRVDSGLRRAWRGASAAEERGAPTEATELLAEALEKEPLTIVATGSVTTIASVLLRHPQSASRIDRVIVIAGRSLDGPASPPSGGGQADGNADIDPASMQVLLDSPVALTLVRPGPGSGAVLDTADLERLDAGHGPIKLITPSARAWLQAVTGRDGATAFPVPAMLAVDAAAHPGQVRCEPAVASLSPAGGAGRHVQVTNGTAGRRVNWCHTADAGARTRMVDDVLRVRPVAR
jgi:inosine-uridine nucleoside N-ribohydrolase